MICWHTVAFGKLQVALSKLWCLFCWTTASLMRGIEGVPPYISFPWPFIYRLSGLPQPLQGKYRWLRPSILSLEDQMSIPKSLRAQFLHFTLQLLRVNNGVCFCELWLGSLWWYWWYIYLKLPIPQHPSFPALPGCSEFEQPGQQTVACAWRHPHLPLGMKEISENSSMGREWSNCRSAAEYITERRQLPRKTGSAEQQVEIRNDKPNPV